MRIRLLSGLIAGFVGALGMWLVILLSYFFGFHIRIIPAITELFVTDSFLGTFQASIVGVIAHFICGGILGIAFLLTLEITGYSNWILKGAAGGAVVWFLLCGMLAKILNISMRSDAVNSLANLVVHIIYGIITSLVIVYFHNRTNIENKHEV